MKVFTIGFTQKTSKDFFETLISNQVKKIVDVRLNNKSQLAGFAKAQDLKYFLKKIADIEYVYMPEFAPTKELLDGYRANRISWSDYEQEYLRILQTRKALNELDLKQFENACFLCSEGTANKCHRRLAVEYLSKGQEGIEIKHL